MNYSWMLNPNQRPITILILLLQKILISKYFYSLNKIKIKLSYTDINTPIKKFTYIKLLHLIQLQYEIIYYIKYELTMTNKFEETRYNAIEHENYLKNLALYLIVLFIKLSEKIQLYIKSIINNNLILPNNIESSSISHTLSLSDYIKSILLPPDTGNSNDIITIELNNNIYYYNPSLENFNNLITTIQFYPEKFILELNDKYSSNSSLYKDLYKKHIILSYINRTQILFYPYFIQQNISTSAPVEKNTGESKTL